MMQPEDYLQLTIPAAQAAENATGIRASITLAQAALESGWGAHTPTDSYNQFGIKAVAGQAFVMALTPEYIHGNLVHIQQAFAKYANMAGSFAAHTKLIATSHIYSAAMKVRNDPAQFAAALQACGYSTSPFYAKSLMQLVNQYNLTQYDAEPNLA